MLHILKHFVLLRGANMGSRSGSRSRSESGSSKDGLSTLVQEYPFEQFPNWTISGSERYYVPAPIDRWGEWAFHLRSHITMLILSGNPAIQFLQRFQSPAMTKLANVFSWLGLEDFYLILIVSQLWLFDARLGRLLAVLLSLGFFTSGTLKNGLSLPRPPAPPALLLGEENKDWAWPSNHALLGTAFPWFIWMYASKYNDLSLSASLLLLAVVFIWNCGVIWARVYLGVHSPCDVLAGWMIGVLLLFVYQGFADKLYSMYLMASSGDSSFFYYFSAVFLILQAIHPRAWPETQSYGEVVSVLSGTVGIWCSRGLNLGDRKQPFESLMESSADATVLDCLIRLFVGLAVVMVVRAVIKALFRLIVSLTLSLCAIPYYSYSAMCKRYGDLQPTKRYTIKMRFKAFPGDKTLSSDKLPVDMDLPVKFMMYSVIGLMVGEGCPLIFQYLNV